MQAIWTHWLAALPQPSDIVVELAGVRKTFRQQQRSARLRDALRNLFRPTIREVRRCAASTSTSAAARSWPTPARTAPARAPRSSCSRACWRPTRGTVRALGMDPVRERVRYVGRIGVVFGQRTELWWDHPSRPASSGSAWSGTSRGRATSACTALVSELLGLDEFFNTDAAS